MAKFHARFTLGMDRKRFDRYIILAVYIVESEDHERNEIMFLIAAYNC